MDHVERMAEYQAKVNRIYAQKVPLLRQGKERKKVEEYLSLAEEHLAVSTDVDRAESKLKFCDTDTQRGQNQHAEYTRMVEDGRKRIEEIEPKLDRLRVEFGI